MTKEFDARNAKKSRAVCEAMAERAETGKRVLTEREKLILDMWPKFEDGEYVWFGDAYVDWSGDANKVRGVRFNDRRVCLVGIDDFLTVFNIVECAKRPATKALDADGVEIKLGDTVWHCIGIYDELVVEEIDDESGWVRTRSANGACLSAYHTHLTHTRPDSWERLEEDAESIRQIIACNFGDFSPSDFKQSGDSLQDRVSGLVRRAKALAGAEAGR